MRDVDAGRRVTAAWAPAPPAPLGVSRDGVHVWRAALDQADATLARLRAALGPEEHERAGRFRTPALAARFVVGRGVVREVLARYVEEEPAALRFVLGERGKPSLAPPHAWLRFNTSNSGGLALVAVAVDRDVGVDVEALRPVPEALAISRRMFSAHEQAALRALPEAVREEAFLHCWTRKEAFIKAVGTGLWSGLDGFDVALGPGVEACLLAVGGSAAAARRWTLRALAPGPGYLGAVVAQGPIGTLSTFDWDG